jgi:tetratricopeptide (TPR) repeat protein
VSKTDKRRLETHFQETFDLRVSSVGVSANSLLSYLKSSVSNPDYHIHSYVAAAAGKPTLTVWGLTPDDRILDYTTAPSNNADDIAIEAAESIEKAFDPLLLASYLFDQESVNSKDKDHAGSLKITMELVGADPTGERSQKANATNEERARAYNLLGLILADQNQLTEATTKYRQSVDWAQKEEQVRRWPAWRLTLYNQHVVALAYANWGDALRRLGHSEDALEKYKDSGLWQREFESVFSEWGQKQSLTNDEIGKRKKQYEDQILTSPTDTAAYVDMGRLLWSTGSRQEAAEYLKSAVNAEPNDLAILLISGYVMYELADYDTARKNVLHAVEVDGTSVDAWQLLALTEKRLGLAGEADAAANRTLALFRPEDRPSFQ